MPITRDRLWQKGWDMRDFTVGWAAIKGPLELWYPDCIVKYHGHDIGVYKTMEELDALTHALRIE